MRINPADNWGGFRGFGHWIILSSDSRHPSPERMLGQDSHETRRSGPSWVRRHLRDKASPHGVPERSTVQGKTPRNAVLAVERRVGHESVVRVDGNSCSVPARTRKRVGAVQNHTHEIRISKEGGRVAVHPVPEGRNQARVGPAHRHTPPARRSVPQTPGVPLGSRTFYGAGGKRLAAEGARS